MTKQLLEYINGLNIRSFLLDSGITLIGKVEERDEFIVELRSAFAIEYVELEHTQGHHLIPLIPSSINELSKLSVKSIAVDSEVSFELKKHYCDLLMRLKLQKIQFAQPLNKPQGKQNKSIDLEKSDDHGISDPFKDRWS